MNTRKRFIPQPWRQKAWQIALQQTHHDVLGSRMFTPADARDKSLLLGENKPAVARRIGAVLRPRVTFCDVGANIAVFTLLAAKLVGKTGRVVAFAPIPDNARVLRTNIALNGRANVLLLEKAIAEKRDRAEIHLSSLCGCMVARPDVSAGNTFSVETVDAEGAEISVLRSLGTRRPGQILEYKAERLNVAGYTGAQFLDVLSSLGYSEIEDLHNPWAGLEQIVKGQINATNLFTTFKAGA